MIKKKRSFVWREDLNFFIFDDLLPKETQFNLFEAKVSYGLYGIKPEFSPVLERIAFKPIKIIIDDSNATYKGKCNTNRKNGKKGGAPKGICNNPWGCKGKPLHLKVKSKSEPRTEENQQSNYDDGKYRNTLDYSSLSQSNNNNHIYEDTDLPDEDSQFPASRLN